MCGRKTLWIAAASCALAMGCAGSVEPQQQTESQQEATATTSAADSVSSFTGTLKAVDVVNGHVTITVTGPGGTVTLTHTSSTVHIGVVPGPMRQVGVVPGPMRWLWLLWNDAIAHNAQAIAFLILLDDLAFHHGKVTVTTADGSTIGSVQPVP